MDSLSYVHHSHSSVPPYPVKTNINELSSITPHSVIPCKIEEIKTLSYQLHELANQGLLEWDRRNQGTDLEGFSITSTGKFIIRKNFAELISELMKNKSLGEVIEKEKEEGIGSQTRSFLKTMYAETREKTPQEVVNFAFGMVKQVGYHVIWEGFKWISNSLSHT